MAADPGTGRKWEGCGGDMYPKEKKRAGNGVPGERAKWSQAVQILLFSLPRQGTGNVRIPRAYFSSGEHCGFLHSCFFPAPHPASWTEQGFLDLGQFFI